jgi:kinesin family protein 3/17
MLREFQEEIERLKSELAGRGEGDGGGGMGGSGGGGRGTERVVERIVEVEKLVEVKVGASPEELAEFKRAEEKAVSEKEELRRQAAADMKQLLDQQTHNAAERAALEEKLLEEQRERENAAGKKKKLEDRLKAMEAKLIQGGKMMDKAALQESELREATHKLEKQRLEELRLRQEKQAEADKAIAIEEQFNNVQEEVEVKTRKLKKLWGKFQESEETLKDERAAFQQEKEDMLDTLRDLGRQLKLKSIILANFVPPEGAALIERRAVWNRDREDWDLPRLEVSGNSLRPKRPVSAQGLKRPESEYARQRKTMDPSPRYKYDNILAADLESNERSTQVRFCVRRGT